MMEGQQLELNYKDDKAFVINVSVAGTREKIDMNKGAKSVLSINDKNLQDECAKQPGDFAWYSAILADQEARLGETKSELERYDARLSLEIRQGKIKLMSADGKAEVKLTEGAIQDYKLLDAKRQAVLGDLQYYENVCKRLRSLVAASVQRKDMLIQLALLSRQEMRNFGGPMG